MDPNSLMLDISSDEDADWNDHSKRVFDGGEDYNWYAELFGEGNKEAEVDDDDDDCVVLDKDPNEPVEVRNDNADGNDDSDDVLVVSEKGQVQSGAGGLLGSCLSILTDGGMVACRDYPHSRHLCIKFPFATTPNQSHCNQCYCYVCDSLAPCVYWGNGTATTDHCHATDKDEFWILQRKNTKNGSKVVEPVTQLPPPPQPQNQIPNQALIHTSANFQYPNITGQYGNNVLASRTKLHPDLASQVVIRSHQKYNLNSRVHRPVLKRTSSVRVANQNPYRGNFGNQNYQGNKILSRSSKSLGSLHPSANPSQSPTVNPQPLLPQPQVSSLTNPNFMPHVKSNPFPRTMSKSLGSLHPSANPSQSPTVNPQTLLPQPQFPILTNPDFAPHVNSNLFPQTMNHHQPHLIPPLPSYTVPAHPLYPVPSKTSPVSDFTPYSSQGSQGQGSIAGSGFKDCGLGWAGGQDSAVVDCTNKSSLGGGLGDYQYDWIFDDQPIDPGFTDYSSDSAFIDPGPIFNFHL